MASPTPSLLWGEGYKRGWGGTEQQEGAGHSALHCRPASTDAAMVHAVDCNAVTLQWREDQQNQARFGGHVWILKETGPWAQLCI